MLSVFVNEVSYVFGGCPETKTLQTTIQIELAKAIVSSRIKLRNHETHKQTSTRELLKARPDSPNLQLCSQNPQNILLHVVVRFFNVVFSQCLTSMRFGLNVPASSF